MTDLDLNISYEDGLRISELYGRLADVQYNLDNQDIAMMGEWGFYGVLLALTLGLVAFGVAMYLWLEFLPRHRIEGGLKEAVCIIAFLAAIAVLWYALTCLTVDVMEPLIIAGWERDAASYQAQIDAIIAKYTGVWT